MRSLLFPYTTLFRSHLPSQQMEVLRCCRWLAQLHVVSRGKLQIALDSGARMLWALSLVSVGKQHYQTAQQSPFVLACRDELVNYDLCAIGEIAELRLPQNQGL